MNSLYEQRKSTLPKAIKALKSTLFRGQTMPAISLFDLPKNQVRVKLTAEFRKKIFYALLKKYGSFSGIARATNLKRGECVRRYFIERSGMPLEFLDKVSELIKISKEAIQKNVIELKTMKSKESIKKPVLPFKITPEFALVVGGVLGDGGIDKRTYRVWYFNNEKQQIESFIAAVTNTFGNVGFAFRRSISGTPCVIFPKIIGIILKTIGLEEGNKNYKVNVGIPDVLLNTKDKRNKIALLQRLFDDDGTVVNHHNNRCVSFTAPQTIVAGRNKIEPKILLDIKKILQEFEITSHICAFNKNFKGNGEITINWEIRIRGKENLQKFHDKIGFGLERKQEKLQATLNRYVKGLEFYPRNEAKEHYLALIKKLNQKNTSLTANNIAKFCKRNNRHIREVLANLTKAGLLCRQLDKRKFVYKVIE